MISNFRRIRTMAAASAMAVALTFAAPVTAFTALAATGTVTGSSINVRSEASTNGSIVGTVNTGDTVTVGETTTDSDGATWYQVTLSNGTTGYVRGDYITVSDDSGDGTSTDDGSGTDVSADASSDVSADASSDASSDASTESSDPAVTAATTAAEQDTGGYSIVLAPDGDTGEQTYYLYDNNNSVRMKISDIQKLPDEVTAAQQEAASVRTRYRVILIALAAVAAALLIGCIVLGLKLRDALANGRRERDLTMERRDQRRNNRNADSVEALRHGRGSAAPSRTGRGRDDAYASGARRYGRDEDAAGARRYGRDDAAGARRYGRDEDDRDGDIRGTRTSTTSPVYSERRPAGREDAYGRRSAQGGARESSLPARQSSVRGGDGDDQDVRADRPVRSGTRATRAARSEDVRSAGAGRDEDARYSRTDDARDAGVREGRQDAGRSAQSAPARSTRSAAGAGERRAARPAAGGQSRPQSASGNGASNRATNGAASGRGAAKNYSDDDFDYDFLQLDDGDDQ